MTRIGNYEIKKQIGEGGFGRIYQAEHIILGEKACIKQNTESTPEAEELLRSEAKILWKLDGFHSIPTVKDFLKLSRNSCALVMSYIDGQTLADIVANNSRLHAEDACWVTERLLGALYFCHDYGVIHADVKPENVFVEPKKHDIKLIDFGLSAYRPSSGTKPAGYTPRYAAPELALGKPPIPETDIYGAGMVLLYALGGDVASKAFPADVAEEIAQFGNEMLRYDPTERICWDKVNLIEKLSDIRQKVFGRRHRR